MLRIVRIAGDGEDHFVARRSRKIVRMVNVLPTDTGGESDEERERN